MGCYKCFNRMINDDGNSGWEELSPKVRTLKKIKVLNWGENAQNLDRKSGAGGGGGRK